MEGIFKGVFEGLIIFGILVGIILSCIVGGTFYYFSRPPKPETQQLLDSAKEKLTPEEWAALEKEL